MARVRGVGPGDRAAQIEMVTAVLSRDREAVAWLRAELVRRRDRAAENLGFELAGRLQAEIRAADWVTAEQKVTQAGSEGADIHGWAGGVLVSCAIRSGRLSVWRQRSCAQAAAGALVAATPPAWAPFARRNAELAARLTLASRE